jgi:hypothetical protein
MAGELLDHLFSFDPNDAEIKNNSLSYHSRARTLVNQLHGIPIQRFNKDADTEQDPLKVCVADIMLCHAADDDVNSSSTPPSIQLHTYLRYKLV